MDAKKRDYVEKAAYFIWLNDGRPAGRELDNWAEAERIYELMHLIAPLALSAPKIRAELEARKKAVLKAATPKKDFKKTSKGKAKMAVLATSKKAAPVRAKVKAPARAPAKAKIIPMSRVITRSKAACTPAKKPGLRLAAASARAPKSRFKKIAAPSCPPKRASFKKY